MAVKLLRPAGTRHALRCVSKYETNVHYLTTISVPFGPTSAQTVVSATVCALDFPL